MCRQALGVAQLFGALAAQVLFGNLAVYVALVNKGDFIFATMFAFHNRYLLILRKCFSLTNETGPLLFYAA